MELRIVTLAARPDLDARRRLLDAAWPAFAHHDPNGLFFAPPGCEEFTLYGVSDSDPDLPVARAVSVPLRLDWEQSEEDHPETLDLPDDGLDEVVRWAADDRLHGRAPDVVASVEISVHPDLRGRGIGTRMLAALLGNARRLGFDLMIAPVRPVAKHLEPHVPMAEYAARVRLDGLPADPWIRAHARLGATMVRIAAYSSVVPGTLAQWRRWTGLPFDRSGPTVVPEALVPVTAIVDHDYAVYVEPNVWMRHDL